MLLDAIVRRFPALKTLSEATQSLRLTGQLSLAAAQVEGEGCEESRSGRRFWMGPGNGVSDQGAVASLSATPSFQWVIWNTSTSKSLVMDALGVFNTSGAPVAGGNVLACALFTAPAQTGSSSTGISIASMSGGGIASVAIVKVGGIAPTAPSATPTITPIGKMDSNGTTTFQQAIINDNLKGRIIVPPSTGLGMIVYGSSTSTKFAPFGWWVEKELDLE